jgi:fatty-acyl-CoA synthase
MTRKVGSLHVVRRLAEAGLLTPGAIFAFLHTAIGQGVTLAALARFAARRFGDRVAVSDETRRLSFSALANEGDRLAAILSIRHRIERGTAVGVLCRNGCDFVLAMVAASRLGARVLLMNPEMSGPQLRALVERHGIRLVLGQADTLDSLGATVETVDVSALGRAAPPGDARLRRLDGGELVILTGGTTGPPKAASRKPLPRAFLLLFVHLVTALELDRRQRVYVAVPLCHGYGVAAFLVALTLGRTVHLMARYRTEDAVALIKREDIDVLAVVPVILQRLLSAEGADLSGVKRVITGGAALPPALARRTQERLGLVLFNLFGSSEAGVSVFATPEDLADAPATIGREIWGVRADVLDDHDQPVAIGKVGRLVIRNRAAMTGARAVATGDLASRDPEGRLYIHGRADDMVISGGEKVHPWEVESALMDHPDVQEAAVLGVADPEFGQRLSAFVVARAGSDLTAQTLDAWLAERVARYQRPRDIAFRDALPVTTVGKLDRRALHRALEGVD